MVTSIRRELEKAQNALKPAIQDMVYSTQASGLSHYTLHTTQYIRRLPSPDPVMKGRQPQQRGDHLAQHHLRSAAMPRPTTDIRQAEVGNRNSEIADTGIRQYTLCGGTPMWLPMACMA